VAKTSHEEGSEEIEETETDAAEDTRARISETVGIVAEDSTLNLVPTSGGKVLMALSDAGLQFLVAASRANVGVKSGRYLFEVRVVEVLLPAIPGGRMNPIAPIPRQLCRVGFSKQGSSLFLGETEDSVCFDADGCFLFNKQKNSVAERFVRDHVWGVLLNLDPASPNCNTVSLFKDGRRVCKPQPLPEQLKGHALFPHVSFRNVTLQVHFGPMLMSPLSFKIRSIQEAAAEDAVVAPSSYSQDGKFEVIFPVSLPDEGTFDWLADFLEQHPGYVEISDRMIVEWATMSGLGKPRITSLKNCNDKPDVNFGIQVIDELSPRRLVYAVAPLVPRNYVVMEVRSNLIKAERQDLALRFDFPHFKRVALVVVGEPPEAFKAKVHSVLLAEKQEKLDAEWKVRQADKERQRQLESLRAQQLALQEQQRKAAEAAKAEAPEAAEGASAEAKDEEMKEEGAEVKEEAKEDADVQMKEEPKEEPEAPPVAELDEEESRLWFLPRSTTDMVSVTFNSTFADFTLPDETENFSEIRYEWAGEVASKDYMKSWMQAKKITTRVEELFPDDTFTNRVLEWQRVQGDWQYRQKELKTDPVRQQAANTRMEKEKKYQEKLNKPKSEEKEGGEGEAEAAPAEGEDAAELEGFVPVDIHTVEDVLDIGEGEPLFAHFAFEDWALMNLRFEMAMLMSAFSQAVVDPDRPGVHEAHLTYYYNRYFRKPLNVKYFGANNSVELCELIKDVVTVLDNGILRPTLTEEQLINQDIFVRLTEEDRRERQRLIDAGDESIRLKLSVLAQQQMNQPSPWAAKAAPKAWATQAAWPGVGPAPVAARPGFVRGPGAAGGKGAGWDWAPTNFGGPPAWGGGKGGYPPMGPMGGMGGMGW